MTTTTTTPAHHPLPVTLDELAAVVKAKGVHFYVATPAYGCKLTSRYVLSLLKFQATCLSKGIEISVDFLGNESLITRGRSIMAARFLKTNATHLLFLDADVGFDPLSLLRMAAFEKDVVCGIYSKKASIGQRFARDFCAATTPTNPSTPRAWTSISTSNRRMRARRRSVCTMDLSKYTMPPLDACSFPKTRCSNWRRSTAGHWQ